MPYRSAHLPMMNSGGPRPTRTAIPDSSGRCPAGWTTGPSGCHARIRTAILGVKVRCPAVGRHGMVAGGGIEPPTSGFRDRRSATELTRSVGGPTGLEPAYLEPQSSALPLSYSPHENWNLVGSAGLEPTASATPRQRSTRLSYDPFWSEWADSNRRPARGIAARLRASRQRTALSRPACGRYGARLVGPSHALCRLSYIQMWSSQLDLNQHPCDPNAVLCQVELWPVVGDDGVEPRASKRTWSTARCRSHRP